MFLGGQSTRDHALPFAERCSILRNIMVEWNTGRSEPNLTLKIINPVAMINWEAVIVDACLYLLTGAHRRTPLGQLGATPGGTLDLVTGEITRTLLESFASKGDDDLLEELVNFIHEHKDRPVAILDRALEVGFTVGERIEVRGANSPQPVAPTSQGGDPQPAAPTSQGGSRELQQRNTDEELAHQTHKRTLSSLELESAHSRVAVAKAKASHQGVASTVTVVQAQGPSPQHGAAAASTLGSAAMLLSHALQPSHPPHDEVLPPAKDLGLDRGLLPTSPAAAAARATQRPNDTMTQ